MANSKKRRWTAKENTEIIIGGETNDETLAAKLNRTVFSVRKQRERLKAKGVKVYLEPWEAKIKEVELGQWKPGSPVIER